MSGCASAHAVFHLKFHSGHCLDPSLRVGRVMPFHARRNSSSPRRWPPVLLFMEFRSWAI